MSLLQNQDFVLYRIRNRYLHYMRDGVGERLITVNPTALNVPAFKNAGWGCPSEIRRTYSPPIPVGTSTEYFTSRAPLSVRDTDSPVAVQVGGVDGVRSFMRPGLASHFSNESVDTIGTGTAARLEEVKEKGRREEHGDREDDSSDMSEESEDDEGGTAPPQKAQFDFAKKEIPQRPRSGSSPLHSGHRVPDTSITRSRVRRLRGGSHGDVDFNAPKLQHANTDSNSFSKPSEEVLSNGLISASERLHAEIAEKLRLSPNSSFLTRTTSTFDDDYNDDDDGSDASSLDSDFTETAESNPTTGFPGKKQPPASPSILHALPPPIRPVSQVQPISALTQLLKAKESQVANPMEDFQEFAGKGELTPITLKLYIPYSKSSPPFQVIIKRTRKVQATGGGDTTVAEAIGFALYRYIEEQKSPELRDELCDVNKWVLRMVDDGEPDEDFPPLERTQPITAYIAQGGRRGGRGATAVKLEGEFALVEATREQYAENERATPNKTSRKKTTTTTTAPLTIPTTETILLTPLTPTQPPPSILTPVTPTPVLTPASPPKILRIHISATDAFAHSISLPVLPNTPLSTVLQEVCRKKFLTPAHHVLRMTGAPQQAVLPLTTLVSTLSGRAELDLVRNPALPPPTPAAPPPAQPAPVVANTEFAPPALDYQRFTVYRKSSTPMSFLSRHERILAIDGEYLHIQSSRKSRSVHVSGIIGVKVCRRAGLKILVWRKGSGNRGERERLEFETGSAEVAGEVVAGVRRAMEGFISG